MAVILCIVAGVLASRVFHSGEAGWLVSVVLVLLTPERVGVDGDTAHLLRDIANAIREAKP